MTYSTQQPDLVILLGARTIVSLLGIVAMAIGHWNWERAHEQEDQENDRNGDERQQHGGEEGLTKSGARPNSSSAVPGSSNYTAMDPEGLKVQPRSSGNDETTAPASSSSGRSAWNWQGLRQAMNMGGAAAPVDQSTTSTSPTITTSSTPYTLQTPSTTTTNNAATTIESTSAQPQTQTLLLSPLHALLSTIFTSSLHTWSLVTISGYLLLSISCLMDPNSYSSLYVSVFSISTMMITLLVALMHYMYHHDHVERINLPPFVAGYAFMLVVVWSLMVVLSNDAYHTLNWAPPLGSSLVVLSHLVAWCSKRHGGSWLYFKTGKLNVRPVVFHLGGPLMVWGYWMIWWGMNAVHGNPDAWYLPVFLGSRTAMSYTASTFIVLVVWSTSYAYDEAPIPTIPTQHDSYGIPITETSTQRFASLRHLLLSGPGFGCLGYFFGAVWEIKLGLTLVWILWGITVFLPTLESLWPLALFVLLALHGIAQSIWYEIAVRAIGTPDVMKRWVVNCGGILLLIAICLAVEGVTAALLAVPGVILLWVGQLISHHDRKKGHMFVTTGQVNPHPKVFSYGGPLTTLGMTLLAWALSLRY